MRYAAWNARLDTHIRNKEGESTGTERQHLEVLARRGVASAIDALTPPEFPASLAYLWEWSCEIRRGLGMGFDGINSLTWLVLDAWSRMTGNRPQSHEVDALFALDAAVRHPDAVLEGA